ncbi:MAG: GNAT family N-acetyltransferase [Chlorobia bacterium]|nr:GNAT family N-acetyltransferase [Fimbriimonadaceae bacterium]
MSVPDLRLPYRARIIDDLPVIETNRLILMIAMTDQVPLIIRYLTRNREHLRPWEPKRNEAYYKEPSWIGAPERDQHEARNREAFRFRLLAKSPDLVALPKGEYLGTVSLREIQVWPMHNAVIGYSLDHAAEGLGLMLEAVAAVVRFGFEHLNLKRIEACYMPSNLRSERLLAKLHFQTEGLLRSSLEVDGKWEDHHICSLINQNWRRS